MASHLAEDQLFEHATLVTETPARIPRLRWSIDAGSGRPVAIWVCERRPAIAPSTHAVSEA